MGLSRSLPQTNPSRLAAIKAGKTMLDSDLATTIISAATKSRLNAIHTNYIAKYLARNVAKAIRQQATVLKDETQATAITWISHFFQALFNAIKRHVVGYNNTDKVFYDIEANSNLTPVMKSEPQVVAAGDQMVNGETARIANGGTALPFPTMVESKTKFDDFKAKSLLQTQKGILLDTAQEQYDALNTEADGTILKLWDEVETFYNEEEPESKRANARDWGVIYKSDTDKITIVTGKTVEQGAAVNVEAHLEFIETQTVTDADANGNFTKELKYEGEVTVHITADEYEDKDVTFNLPPATPPNAQGKYELDLGTIELVKIV